MEVYRPDSQQSTASCEVLLERVKRSKGVQISYCLPYPVLKESAEQYAGRRFSDLWRRNPPVE